MKEVKKELKLFEVKAYCDCGGEYKIQEYYVSPTTKKYGYTCDKCGKKEILTKEYPYKEEVIDNDND